MTIKVITTKMMFFDDNKMIKLNNNTEINSVILVFTS